MHRIRVVLNVKHNSPASVRNLDLVILEVDQPGCLVVECHKAAVVREVVSIDTNRALDVRQTLFQIFSATIVSIEGTSHRVQKDGHKIVYLWLETFLGEALHLGRQTRGFAARRKMK